MSKQSIGFFLALAALITGLAEVALGQNGPLQRRLASATRVDCRFSALATGTWNDNTASASVAPAEFEALYSDVNVDEGTAEADSRFGSSLIVVRFSGAYLHLMQISDVGPLYVTTVFAAETTDGRMMAVHTRHEYAASSYPQFSTRPEMYVGDCAVGNSDAVTEGG